MSPSPTYGCRTAHGIELYRDLRSKLPELNCLLLTSFTDEPAMLDAVTAGVGGYVIKDIKGLELVSAVRAVGSGRSLLATRAAAALMGQAASQCRAAGTTGRSDF
jgi:DNA-binding NarL/FixJ family response regulator